MKLRATIVLSVAVCACASPAAPQRNVAPDERSPDVRNVPNVWRLSYSSGTTLQTNGINQPVVAVPGNGSLNMLTKAWAGSAAGQTLYVALQMQTTGAPMIELAQGPEPMCRTPPSTRPYLEANGWTTMPPAYSYMRWWSRQGFIPLSAAGTFSIEVPLTADRWSGVSGQLATQDAPSLSWFDQMVTASVPSRIGLVFGGGCSYGHGLYVSGGSATLTVTEFETR